MAAGRESKELEFKPYPLPPLDPNLSPLIRESNFGDTLTLDYGQNSPDHYPFDIYHAYSLRINSFINGTLYALNQKAGVADGEKLKYIEKKIENVHELRDKKLHELQEFKSAAQAKPARFEAELQHFFYHELPLASGLECEQLALAEAFYVWQEVDRPKRICRHIRDLGPQGKLIIEQIDIPRRTPLTTKQKTELLRIYQIQKPDWYRVLPSWAKIVLSRIVPQTNEEDGWHQYERCRPATLRHIPGEANAGTHLVQITHLDTEDEVVQTASYPMEKQGTPSSYNMKNKAERQASANENLRQMLDATLPLQKAKFEAAWGISPAQAKIKIPVLLEGLLTPSYQAGLLTKLLDLSQASGDENNTLLELEKRRALQNYLCNNPLFRTPKGQANNITKSSPLLTLESVNDGTKFLLFNTNVPANAKLSKPVAPRKDYIQVINDFCLQMEPQLRLQKQSGSENKDTVDKRIHDLQILKSISQQLKILLTQDINIKGRNRNLYLAALYDLSTRLMGGLSTVHCKSSKDRLAAELIMALSILTFCAEQEAQGKPIAIPAYSDHGPARQKFVDLFCESYASGHHLLMANDSSPGAPGIKDEGILDEDFIAKLQSMRQPGSPINLKDTKLNKKDLNGTFAQSRQAADFNKPGSFWRKFGGKILFYSIICSVIILTLLALSLTLSGVLSPIGIIGLTAAANLGSMAIPVGLGANFGIIVGSGVIISALSCKLAQLHDTLGNMKNSFKAQIKAIKLQELKKDADTLSVNQGPVAFNTFKMNALGLNPSVDAAQPLLSDSPNPSDSIDGERKYGPRIDKEKAYFTPINPEADKSPIADDPCYTLSK